MIKSALVLILAIASTAASADVASSTAPVSKPHLIMVLQDDLGHYDTGITNPDNLNVTANITQLAKDGVVLEQHYVYYWCSFR